MRNPIRNINICKLRAALERITGYRFCPPKFKVVLAADRAGGSKACAAAERSATDRCYTGWNYDFRKSCAVVECISTNSS